MRAGGNDGNCDGYQNPYQRWSREDSPRKIVTQITVDELGSSHQSVISFRRYVCSVRYAVAADRRLVRRSVPVAASHIKRRYDV